MADRWIQYCFRPRNLRIIVLLLVATTILLSIVFIFSGIFQTEESSTVSVRTDSNQIQFDSNISHQSYKNYQDRLTSGELEGNQGLSYNSYHGSLIPRNRTKIYPEKCQAINTFKPDMDSTRIYSNLSFNGPWIDSREFWDQGFDRRYRQIITSKDTPILKVFVIPHSHTDPGWLRTFEEYFYLQTKDIIDNAVDKLEELPRMKFQLSEISFLAKWFQYAHPTRREILRKLVKDGRLEIATGGWVMTDEATVNLYSMIDQLVEGHQWIKSHLNIVPKTSWSVDPFGHGSTLPYLLQAAGIDAMIIQRIHYAWKRYFAETQNGDFRWVQRWDSDASRSILCHNNPFDIYSIKHSCGPNPHICLSFDFRNISGEHSENAYFMQPITKENLQEKAELLLDQYRKAATLFPHNVALVSLGDDFRYSYPLEWNQQYYNYLAIFNYINANRDTYRAQFQFGTISEYFKAIRQRSRSFPSFSGDFFVYSDIFSDGRPAYWSGYFGTRPFWKKFYRETENALRGAEILYTYATALARQNGHQSTLYVMNREYEPLCIARQNLALFAHHDAATGTSKANTMNDYGLKLLVAKQNSMKIQQLAISSILFGQSEHSHLSIDYEESSFGSLAKQVPLRLSRSEEVKKVILFNSLGWTISHLAKVIVKIPNVMVLDSNGRVVASQLNPIVDLQGDYPIISTSLFELTFISELSALSLTTFTIKATSGAPGTDGAAVLASIYCKQCRGPDNLFEINSFETGNIQLTSSRLQLLFDRQTGFLLAIKKLKENVVVDAKMTFGVYRSVDHRSGAYLLMLDTAYPTESIPTASSKVFIFSGPLTSELAVDAGSIVVSTKIFHSGGLPYEDGVYIQTKVNTGARRGEFFMRFDTDLDSTAPVGINGTKLPIFFTDSNGYTIEKRIKVPSINLEGNVYPVNTMTYIEDMRRNLRFSVLVDRAHGFSSFDTGRLETLIERRTIVDDGRGMGEGVTDNRETISNYVITLERLGHYDQTADETKPLSLPTLTAHHLSQLLQYSPSLFVLDYENFPERFQSTGPVTILTESLPCDTHLVNLRTLSEDKRFDVDINLPSPKALMILQKLGYHCLSLVDNGNENCANGNSQTQSLFYANTTFSGVRTARITTCGLTGIDNSTFRTISNLENIMAKPFEIKTLRIKF